MRRRRLDFEKGFLGYEPFVIAFKQEGWLSQLTKGPGSGFHNMESEGSLVAESGREAASHERIGCELCPPQSRGSHRPQGFLQRKKRHFPRRR